MGEQIAKRSRSDGEAALVMARRREEAKAWRAAFRSPRDACPPTLYCSIHITVDSDPLGNLIFRARARVRGAAGTAH